MTEENSQQENTPGVAPVAPPVAISTPTSSTDTSSLGGSNNKNNYNNSYVPRQGNNRNRSYNGSRQTYQKNYNNSNSNNTSNSSNKTNANGYSRYNKNRPNNYNNSMKNNSFNNTNRYNNGSRFNNSQYYNVSNSNNMVMPNSEEFIAQQQQQQPNMAWSGYYVPQMYYIPQQMAAAMVSANNSLPNAIPVDVTNTTNGNIATNNNNPNLSPIMTSPQLNMAALNTPAVPLIPTQSPPMMSLNASMSGPNSNDNTTSNLTSPILTHTTPILSPPKKKIEITTKTGEKLDLSQIHSQHKISTSPSTSKISSPKKLDHTMLNVSTEDKQKETVAAADTTTTTTEAVSEKQESEAEKNKKAFLEQVRLRKLAMDKKKQLEAGVKSDTTNDDDNKNEIENEVTQTTIQGDETIESIHESTPLETKYTEEKKATDLEEIVQEKENQEGAEHVMTFAEKLKLKKYTHDSDITESVSPGKQPGEEPVTVPTSVEIKPETTEENKLSNTTDKDEKKADQDDMLPKDSGDVLEMTTFINKLKDTAPVDDIYTFKYPSAFESPNPKYKRSHIKYSYGPTFLLQFKDKIKCKPDEEWINSTQSKIVILPSMNKQKNRVNFAGGPDGARAGSLRNLDSKANSRANSKRQSSRRFEDRKSNRSSYTPRRDRMENASRRDTKRDSAGHFHQEKSEPPKEEVAPLVPSANRWVPKFKSKKSEKKLAPDGVTELFDHEEVQRKMKSLLNKLTLEKFEPISSEIIAIANQSQWETNGDTLRNVIEQIFLKACDEPYWSSMYAQLCGKIVKDLKPEIADENNEGKTGPKLVLHYLVVRCHTEFEKGWTDKLPTKEDGSPLEPEMMSDEYYVLAAAKRRGLGLVRFIGFLYRLNLLTGKMMFECFRRLMKDLTESVSEETLESLVELLTTVGRQFENDSFSTGKGTLDGSVLFDKLFQLLQSIIDEGSISNRVKFKLIDVKELREDKHWNSEKTNQGPKTIQQIHDEEEKARQEKASNSRAPSRRNNTSSYNRGERTGGYRRDMSSRDHFNTANNNTYSNRNSQYSNSGTQRYNSRSAVKEEKPAPAHPTNRFDALLHATGDDY